MSNGKRNSRQVMRSAFFEIHSNYVQLSVCKHGIWHDDGK